MGREDRDKDRDRHRHRSRSRERDERKERGGDREKDRGDRDRGDRERGDRDRGDRRDRDRDRERRDRRSRSRSRSRSGSPRRRKRSPVFMAGPSGRHDESPQSDLSPEELQIREIMGFGSFHSTKGKKVEGNNQGAVHVIMKRKYRQYMNRKGGFNRPLDFVA